MDPVTFVLSLITSNPVISTAIGTFLATHLNAKYHWIPKILTGLATAANPNLSLTPTPNNANTAPTPTGQTQMDFVLSRLSALESRITTLESKVVIVK